jgi:hypothetical protein
VLASNRLIRLVGAVLMALLLAACAQLRDQVGVGIGTKFYTFHDAAPYAALYRPYAQMARLAYANQKFLTPEHYHGPLGGPLCPIASKLDRPDLADDPEQANDNALAAQWERQLKHDGWHCLFGQVGAAGCPPGQRCVTGLQLQVWRRGCGEAVVAFRGTDRRDIGDWISNLHWILGRYFYDQYYEVRDRISEIVDRASRGCHLRHVTATGHSLGGGLAQLAGYADRRIDYVYAFDPSPVTGYFSVPWEQKKPSVRILGTDRIYQAGEILSLPRYLTSGFFPTPSCRPRARIVRFATIPEPSLLERHRITLLTKSIVDLAKTAKPGPLPKGYRDARTCTLADGAS